MKTVLYPLFIALALAANAPLVHANSAGGSDNCEEQQKPDPKKRPKDQIKQQANIMEMSVKLREILLANASSVAIVSRAGGNLSDRNFRDEGRATKHKYTHAGILYRQADGSLRFIHLLNTCSGPTSDIFEQKVPEFFVDDPYLYDVIVTIPSQELQAKILQVVNDRSVGAKGWARSLHHDKYSNIANPFSTKFQNSNQWALTAIIAAKSGLRTRADAQEYYEKAGFRPSQAKLGGLEVLFGGMVKANTAISDHTDEEQRSGYMNFVSAISLHKFLGQIDRPIVALTELCHSTGCNVPVERLE